MERRDPCGSSAGWRSIPPWIGGFMQYLAKFIGYAVDFMKIEFDLFGYTLSFWNIFIFVCLASIILWAIGGIFGD